MRRILLSAFMVLLIGGTARAQVPSWLGVSVSDGADRGVLIEEVEDQSPAANAGLETGDILLEFDGMRVVGVRQFTRIVRETPIGRTVAVRILRSDREQRFDLTTVSRRGTQDSTGWLPERYRDFSRMAERARDAFSDLRVTTSVRTLGARVESMTDELREFFGVDSDAGVLVSSVEANSPVGQSGLRVGDVIVRVDRRQVDSPADFARRTFAADEPVTLSIVRDRSEMDVTVDPASDE